VELFGLDARRNAAAVKQRIGAALQPTALQEKITPREALRVFASFYDRSVNPEALLERVALADRADARYDTLSGGQRQRLALALAFVNDPELVLLDEPTAGLDVQSRRDLHAEILRMKREGRTVLLTTHQVVEAERLCDRVAIIDRGRVIAEGAPHQLIDQSLRAVTSVHLVTAEAVPRETLAQVSGVEDAVAHGAGVRFQTHDATRTLAALTNMLQERGLKIVELHVQKASLEDVLLDLTGGDGDE
jgi:ABC-2 type transport system ATP-binding protein